MQHSILAVLGAAILAWVVTAARQRSVHSLTFSQAMVFTFFKFVYGIRFSGFDSPADMQGPLVFVVLAQSSLDRTLLKCFLPAGTFHIVAGEGDKSQQQALVKSVLIGRGTICLYFPPQVEASPETMTLLTELGTIASQAGARIMPVYVRGTRFSRFSSWEESKAPRSLLPQITITGGPVSSLGTAEGVHIADALLDAMTLAKFRSVNLSQNLVEALVSSAKLYGTDRTILEDALGGKLDYKTLLIGIRALAGRIHPLSKPGEAIGILLPNANGVVVTLFSVISAGRVAAMLNYTAGPAAVVSAINTAAIRTVICSKAFVEKADLHEMIARVQENGTKIVHIEEIRDGIRPIEKIRAFIHWRKQLVRTAAEDPAVILFTSGSEGTPKGVVLSSRNLIANAAQADCRVDISATDTLFNVLPIFHSFGLLGGTLLPLLYGIRLFLYPSPLHYKIIPGVARKVAPTVMFGTDTFLNGYARAAKEGDFDSLRLLVAGAEAVKPETAQCLWQRFAAEIVEGYGMTEASPVVAVNSATFSKDGSVGRLLPGMEMRLEPVEGIAEGGRLLRRRTQCHARLSAGRQAGRPPATGHQMA